MRGGYPIHLVKVLPFWNDGRLEPDYWHVTAGVAGNCGHHHSTRRDAEGCVQPMTELYRKVRWPKRKKVERAGDEG